MSAVSTVVVLASGRLADDLLGDVGPTDVAWLPLGGRPLLHSILDRYPDDCRVVLTVPEGRGTGYEVFLARFRDAVVLRCDPSDSLAQVAAVALDHAVGSAVLVFGDTLGPAPTHRDEIQVCRAIDASRWTIVHRGEDGELEICPRGSATAAGPAATGIVAVAQPATLAAALRVETDGSEPFFSGLRRYEHESGCRFELRAVDDWLDFGHVDTFHESRRRKLDARVFNSVRFVRDRSAIRKSSEHPDKLRAEAAWLSAVGAVHPSIVPRVVEPPDAGGSYELEYLAVPTIGEALVCCAFDLGYWQRLLGALGRAVDLLHSTPSFDRGGAVAASHAMLVDKTLERLAQLAAPARTTIDRIRRVDGIEVPSTSDAVAIAAEALRPAIERAADRECWIHGDLSFGNLFYDRRADRVVMIDPRGSFGPAEVGAAVGDPLYDLAKLSHSMLGGYDHIIADAFDLTHGSGSVGIELLRSPAAPDHHLGDRFRQWLERRAARLSLTMREVRHAEALCFLSLLPLHAERPDRQLAFAARGLHIVATDGQPG